LKHWASPRFWALYQDLPVEVRKLADKNFELLKADPRHPSLYFKRIGPMRRRFSSTRSTFQLERR